MKNIFDRKGNDEWIRPWNTEKFDDLYNRDDRFFAIVVKGMLSWLNDNILMYNKPIMHFINNTGSSYLYVESNGYDYSLSETSGEDTMYMHLPRCIARVDSINVPQEELTSPYSRGIYERKDSNNNIAGYSSEIRRMPIQMSVTLHYELSNFNESIILVQELIDRLVFQKYFNITYLGQIINCSIEFPNDLTITLNHIDLGAPEKTNKELEISVTICTNYPIINTRSEIKTDKYIASFDTNSTIYQNNGVTDIINKTNIFDPTDDNG